MKKLTIRNIPIETVNQLKIDAKRLRISQNNLIVQILNDHAERKPNLPYDEIDIKLKYLEEMSDLFFFYDDWKTQTNSGEKPYPRTIDIIDLGERKRRDLDG